MAYLGPPPSQKLATPTSQYFSGNGSATAFTLNRPVNVAEDLNVFVNNVAQQPGSGKSYTATGTTLTFDAAPDAGTNNVYVVYRGLAEPTTRLEIDANSSITAATGTFTGAFTSPGIDDNADSTAITIDSSEKVGIGTASPARQLTIENTIANAGGEVGILSSDSSTSGTFGTLHFGNNTDTSLASIRAKADGSTTAGKLEFNTEANGGAIETRMTIDSSGRVTMPAQPAFNAYYSGVGSSYTVAGGGGTIVFNATRFNTGSHYDTSNGRFTAPVAGVYQFSFISFCYNSGQLGAAATAAITLKLNGANYIVLSYVYNASTTSYSPGNGTTVLSLSAADYVEIYTNFGVYTDSTNQYLNFSGYLIS